jgi:hypothetical protein
MLRIVYMPDSNCISLPIPEKYIGTELEITVSPINEISIVKPMETRKKRKIGILDGKVSFNTIGNGKITVEEFLGL